MIDSLVTDEVVAGCFFVSDCMIMCFYEGELLVFNMGCDLGGVWILIFLGGNNLLDMDSVSGIFELGYQFCATRCGAW